MMRFRRAVETHPRHYEGTVEGTRVVLLGTIQGLAGEARHLQAAWDRAGRKDTALALGVPPEDVRNLRLIGSNGVEQFMDQELDTGSYEDWILPQLSEYGDIAMPPDELLLAERLSRDHEAPLLPIDLDDEAYADLYVKHVSGFQMVRGQLRQKRAVADAAERADNPEELMILWDRSLTAIRGYRRFEADREAYMAARLREAAAEHPQVIAVVPYARAAGVAEQLGIEPRR
jgi:hypothetical protein